MSKVVLYIVTYVANGLISACAGYCVGRIESSRIDFRKEMDKRWFKSLEEHKAKTKEEQDNADDN